VRACINRSDYAFVYMNVYVCTRSHRKKTKFLQYSFLNDNTIYLVSVYTLLHLHFLTHDSVLSK